MIVNAVAHRSYLDSAKVQVAIYDDRLEVTSPGMLIGGVTIEELREGYSRPRNFRINMFCNTELVKRTDENNPQDSIQASLNSIQGGLSTIQGSIESSLDVIQDVVIDLTNDKELLKLIASNVSLSQAEMAKILKWNIGKVKYYINKLKRRRIIERVGSSQKGYWNILNNKKHLRKAVLPNETTIHRHSMPGARMLVGFI